MLAHAILWIGIAIVAFPVYLAFVASTQDNAIIANGQMSLLPGGHFLRDLLPDDLRRHERLDPRAGRHDAVQLAS